MRIVKKTCLSLVLLLSSASAAYAQVKGTVLDPRGAVVSDARVILICEGISRSTTTNAEGVFEFPVNIHSDGCYLSVSRSGFHRQQQAMPPGANALLIRLDLAGIAETIDVITENRELLPLVGTTLTTLDLSGEQLKRVSNNTAEMIRYAKLLAGATSGTDVVRVNGFPAAELPPAERVGRIVVNANPFSSEFTDGDRTAIDISTLEPERKFRLSFGGNSLGVGGGNGLSKASRADASSFNTGVSGPIPYLPITFSANATISRSANDVPILPMSSTSQYSARSQATAFSVHHSDGAHLQMQLSHTQSTTESRNLGVGGLTVAEAGFSSTFGAQTTTLAIHSKRESFSYRGGWALMQTDSRLQANRAALGITILGTATSGGAALRKSASQRVNWLSTHVFESNAARRWSAGMTISRAEEHALEEPNPAGVLSFENVQEYQAALSGKSTATWFVTRGNGNARHASLMLAPFAQKLLLNSRKLVLVGGVRIDRQSHFAPLPSPRISAATQWRDFVFRLGAGQFVQTVPENVFVRSAQRDTDRLKDYVASGVSFSDVEKADALEMSSIQIRLSPDLQASRQLMTKSSIERSFGQFHSGVEYTWARDTHLLGVRRVAESDDRWDIIESNRSSSRHQIHTLALYKWKSQTIMGHYEWIRSMDDSEGPYGHPAYQNNLRQEWARTAGVSRQNVTVAGVLTLPSAISVTLIQVWKGSSPYNITTGIYSADGLYTDRGGRPRNSGDGPTYNSLSLMAHKRIPVRGELHCDLGVQADNLLNVTNNMSIGSIVGSDTFGKPISAFPRRSVRFWIRF